jgi:hypothetical protein
VLHATGLDQRRDVLPERLRRLLPVDLRDRARMKSLPWEVRVLIGVFVCDKNTALGT